MNHNNKGNYKSYSNMRHGDKTKDADRGLIGISHKMKKNFIKEHFKVGTFDT